jgi:hypothetical protein
LRMSARPVGASANPQAAMSSSRLRKVDLLAEIDRDPTAIFWG